MRETNSKSFIVFIYTCIHSLHRMYVQPVPTSPFFIFIKIWAFCCCCCSVAKLHLTLCDPMDCSTPGFPVLQYLSEFAQIYVHWVSGVIQLSHPLLHPSPPAFNLFQHQGLFQWVSSLHQVAKVLELQLQHQSFQWILGLISFRIDWFDLLAVQGAFKSLL